MEFRPVDGVPPRSKYASLLRDIVDSGHETVELIDCPATTQYLNALACPKNLPVKVTTSNGKKFVTVLKS